MKIAAKIFIWIGMIFGFFLIYPIIVGIKALKKLETAKEKNDLTRIGILTLLFCNLIAGIVILLMEDSDLNEESQKKINLSEINKNKMIIKLETFIRLVKINNLISLISIIVFIIEVIDLELFIYYTSSGIDLILVAYITSRIMFIVIFIIGQIIIKQIAENKNKVYKLVTLNFIINLFLFGFNLLFASTLIINLITSLVLLILGSILFATKRRIH
jgi:hypothetical protein